MAAEKHGQPAAQHKQPDEHRHHQLNQAEATLGDKFDERKFHDALLLQGSLPMAVLEQRIDAWIAEQKK